jgi:hypothetical protein
MGIPVIKLNLAPPPTLWRLHHGIIAWVVFFVGTFGLGFSVLATLRAYQEADRAGQKTVAFTEQARGAQREQAKVLSALREVNVDQEMPRWLLAERILMERALPWSRVTAELERSLVHNVRLKSIQRTRGTDQTVLLKLRGESRNQESEASFIESLHKNLAFAQVILERQAEITNRRGSLEFDYNLYLNTEPPPYELLPKYGPERKPDQEIYTPDPPKPEVKQPAQVTPTPAPLPQTAPPPQATPPPSQPTTPRERPARQERDRRQTSPRRLSPNRGDFQ